MVLDNGKDQVRLGPPPRSLWVRGCQRTSVRKTESLAQRPGPLPVICVTLKLQTVWTLENSAPSLSDGHGRGVTCHRRLHHCLP